LNCPKSLIKNNNFIREFLKPNDIYFEKAFEQIDHLRKKFDCIVGIHARRGDYKTYLNGKHYHSWNAYKEWIIQTDTVLKNKDYEKVGYILCSDEKPNELIFADLPVQFTNEKKMMIDLIILSNCDYNIGPPSSFGTWISWYGKVPRTIIYENEKILTLKQFQVCNVC
jgi:hypothetical protein